MRCTHPVRIGYAVRPCGQCMACRLNYSSMWAVRCVMESLGYKENVFLTLTFDDEHLPKDKSVSKETLQKFMKRFRKSVYPAKVRFFGSGEYGDKEKRPHYHLLIFGIGLKNPVFYDLRWDMKHCGFWCKCKAWLDDKGHSIGHAFIGTVTIASAEYVAKYVVKKHKGKDAKSYYEKLGVQPEFSLSSRRPGIGLDYLLKNEKQILHNGYISIEGKKFPLPRYYQEKLKENVLFYELFMSGESFEGAQADNERFAALDEALDNPYQYLQDENKQRALNLKKRMSLSNKGVLND